MGKIEVNKVVRTEQYKTKHETSQRNTTDDKISVEKRERIEEKRRDEKR